MLTYNSKGCFGGGLFDCIAFIHELIDDCLSQCQKVGHSYKSTQRDTSAEVSGALLLLRERTDLQPGPSPGPNMETHEKQRSRGRDQLLTYADLPPVSRSPAADSLVKKEH